MRRVPPGQQWNIGAGGTKHEVEEILQQISEQQLWQHDAEGWQGKGLAAGPDVQASLSWLRKLQADGKHSQAGMLETILCGGCWSQQRIGLLEGRPAVPCLWCGAHGADDLHTFWTCPQLQEAKDEEILSTQAMVQAAVE